MTSQVRESSARASLLAEKGMEVERVHVDIMKLEQKSEAMLARNPSGKIPVLETDDGRHIAESVAICRYAKPYSRSRICWARRLRAWLHRIPQSSDRARALDPDRYVLGERPHRRGPGASSRFRRRKRVTRTFPHYERSTASSPTTPGWRAIDSRLRTSLVCAIDFASTLVGLPVPDGLEHLSRWHADVAAAELRGEVGRLSAQV